MHSIPSPHFSFKDIHISTPSLLKLEVFRLNFVYISLFHMLAEYPSHYTTLILDECTRYESPLYETVPTLLQLSVFLVLRFVS
jgi:hypothetical protein